MIARGIGRADTEMTRDVDYGKTLVEQMIMESFVGSFPRVTGRPVEVLSQGESPDFVALVENIETGIELTEIRADSPESYLDEVVRLSSKKEIIFERNGVFRRPTILLCHSDQPPIYDMRRFLDGVPTWCDLTETQFSEIWLMDLSDEYYSIRDPRKPADFYCLSPAEMGGFYECERTRKPFG
jgi:hypothetical protein